MPQSRRSLCTSSCALFHWAKDHAVDAQLIDDFVYKPSIDLAFPSNDSYRSRRILLEAMMIGRSNLVFLLIAVHGTMDEDTTIHVLLRPMPCDEVVDGGHLIDGGGGETGEK